jgi:hypothetical protein
VCWREYSKALGKAVEEVKSVVKEMVSKTKHHFFKDGFQKTSAALAEVCWNGWWFL